MGNQARGLTAKRADKAGFLNWLGGGGDGGLGGEDGNGPLVAGDIVIELVVSRKLIDYLADLVFKDVSLFAGDGFIGVANSDFQILTFRGKLILKRILILIGDFENFKANV